MEVSIVMQPNNAQAQINRLESAQRIKKAQAEAALLQHLTLAEVSRHLSERLQRAYHA